jgi:hypothetical protein
MKRKKGKTEQKKERTTTKENEILAFVYVNVFFFSYNIGLQGHGRPFSCYV